MNYFLLALFLYSFWFSYLVIIGLLLPKYDVSSLVYVHTDKCDRAYWKYTKLTLFYVVIGPLLIPSKIGDNVRGKKFIVISKIYDITRKSIKFLIKKCEE